MTRHHHVRCTGPLVEHLAGPVECTADGCRAPDEEHWLVVRCDEVVCGSCTGGELPHAATRAR